MQRQFWLVKQEPDAYPWSALLKDGRTSWTGVRNFQARNNLRSMRKGDLVLYYHSVSEKQIVGVARVSQEHSPDPSATDGDWSTVEIAPVKPLKAPVSLEILRSDATLKDMPLVRQSRLSVCPVSPEQFDRVLQLRGTRL